MGIGRFFLSFWKPKIAREEKAEGNKHPTVPALPPRGLPLVAKPTPAILSKPSRGMDTAWSGIRNCTAHYAGNERDVTTRHPSEDGTNPLILTSPTPAKFSWSPQSAGTTIDLVRLERAQRPALQRTAAVKRPQKDGRGQGVDPAKKWEQTEEVGFDSRSDIGLQSGPGLLQGISSSRIALYGSKHSRKFQGGSGSLGDGAIPGIPSPVDSQYSTKLKVGFVGVPNGEIGFKVQSSTSTSTAKSSSSTSGLVIGTLTRQIEEPAKSPVREEVQVSGIFGSVTPRIGKRLRRVKQKLAPVPEDHGVTPQQDSQITLCGELAPNGVYKVEESSFQKDYTWVKDVGEGGFGKAELYAHKFTGQMLVCKKTRDPADYTDGVPTEIHITRDVLGNRHPRLPRILHFNHSLAEMHAWMPYYNAGDLYDLLRFYHTAHRRWVPESFIWHIFVQLASAVAYIHTGVDRSCPDRPPPRLWQPVVHRDIKPDNVFLTLTPGQTGYTDAVLADFGLATTTLVSSQDRITGTPMFQPPQLPTHNMASDIWSVGATIHFVATGFPPLLRQDKTLDPRPSFQHDADGSVRHVKDLSRMGYSKWLKEALGEWLSWDEGRRPVGLKGCLKVEGYRMLWLGDGGVEEGMEDWEEWVKEGWVKWGCQRKKEARGFHEE
ncbi:MAG: hypothetical protein Q9202_004499 [Teloschistes flavicans]